MNPLPTSAGTAAGKTDNACLITPVSNLCSTMVDSLSSTSQGHIIKNKRWYDLASQELNES